MKFIKLSVLIFSFVNISSIFYLTFGTPFPICFLSKRVHQLIKFLKVKELPSCIFTIQKHENMKTIINSTIVEGLISGFMNKSYKVRKFKNILSLESLNSAYCIKENESEIKKNYKLALNIYEKSRIIQNLYKKVLTCNLLLHNSIKNIFEIFSFCIEKLINLNEKYKQDLNGIGGIYEIVINLILQENENFLVLHFTKKAIKKKKNKNEKEKIHSKNNLGKKLKLLIPVIEAKLLNDKLQINENSVVVFYRNAFIIIKETNCFMTQKRILEEIEQRHIFLVDKIENIHKKMKKHLEQRKKKKKKQKKIGSRKSKNKNYLHYKRESKSKTRKKLLKDSKKENNEKTKLSCKQMLLKGKTSNINIIEERIAENIYDNTFFLTKDNNTNNYNLNFNKELSFMNKTVKINNIGKNNVLISDKLYDLHPSKLERTDRLLSNSGESEKDYNIIKTKIYFDSERNIKNEMANDLKKDTNIKTLKEDLEEEEYKNDTISVPMSILKQMGEIVANAILSYILVSNKDDFYSSHPKYSTIYNEKEINNNKKNVNGDINDKSYLKNISNNVNNDKFRILMALKALDTKDPNLFFNRNHKFFDISAKSRVFNESNFSKEGGKFENLNEEIVFSDGEDGEDFGGDTFNDRRNKLGKVEKNTLWDKIDFESGERSRKIKTGNGHTNDGNVQYREEGSSKSIGDTLITIGDILEEDGKEGERINNVMTWEKVEDTSIKQSRSTDVVFEKERQRVKEDALRDESIIKGIGGLLNVFGKLFEGKGLLHGTKNRRINGGGGGMGEFILSNPMTKSFVNALASLASNAVEPFLEGMTGTLAQNLLSFSSKTLNSDVKGFTGADRFSSKFYPLNSMSDNGDVVKKRESNENMIKNEIKEEEARKKIYEMPSWDKGNDYVDAHNFEFSSPSSSQFIGSTSFVNEIGNDVSVEELIGLVYMNTKRGILNVFNELMSSSEINIISEKISSFINNEISSAFSESAVKIKKEVQESVEQAVKKIFKDLGPFGEEEILKTDKKGFEKYVKDALKKIFVDFSLMNDLSLHISKVATFYTAQSVEFCTENVHTNMQENFKILNVVEKMLANKCDCANSRERDDGVIDVQTEGRIGVKVPLNNDGYEFSDIRVIEGTNENKKKGRRENIKSAIQYDTETASSDKIKDDFNRWNKMFFPNSDYPVDILDSYLVTLDDLVPKIKGSTNKEITSKNDKSRQEKTESTKKERNISKKNRTKVKPKEEKNLFALKPINTNVWDYFTKNNKIQVKNMEKRSSLSHFERTFLETHNYYRTHAGLSKLKWNDNLEFYVANFRNVGVNLYSILESKTFPESKKNVKTWYNEIYCYRYGKVGSDCTFYWNEKCRKSGGSSPVQTVDNFTQLIWQSATHVGCFMKKCNSYLGKGIKYISGCSYGAENIDYGGNVVLYAPFDSETASLLNLNKEICY